ncbi:MAG TPA: hypothetical protein VGV13_15410 [Methylomirabilota bacterium]|nr:hypothetical protein [Methylomirabilota bacterium]
MATTALPARQRTLRRDLWWLEPAWLFALFSLFVVYSFFAGIANADYFVDPYLSPFYSPCITANCAHLTVGPIVGSWWNLAPAIWIVGFPLTFRLTCYYYRKAYYRAFFWAPAACAVPDARAKYGGETRIPFIWQNIHRFTWYPAVLLVFILGYDAVLAFRFPTASGGYAFGIGLGSLLMTANVVLIALYTFSCHFCRYLVGGRFDRFHLRPVALRLFQAVSWLNGRHGNYAILSLLSVGLTDLYIRLLSMGVVSDPRIVFG